MKVKRALVSVSDKTGLDRLIKLLDDMGVEIISTGGTYKKIKAMGVEAVEISGYTGFPEMMNGRVKTLHPKIHGGLLALRDNSEHMEQAERQGISMIDMVVVNLYPFEETIAKENVTLEEAIENIDIGGPSMLRSAAKNYRSVAVVSCPSQYDEVIRELRGNDGEISLEMSRELALKVFRKTARYDRSISKYLAGATNTPERFPVDMDIQLEKVRPLRYGENPHQKAAFYREPASKNSGIAGACQHQGKELSFNNILDLSAALNMVKDFDEPAVSVVKHNNPCGAASGDTLKKAYIDALDCDRLSAFGSIMGFNGKVDGDLASVILEEASFVECVIAPGYDDNALEVFSAKKNLRVLSAPEAFEDAAAEPDIKKIAGGALVQDADTGTVDRTSLEIPTAKKPTEEQMRSLLFGWKVVKHVKSNAIVLCRDTRTVGIGAGQMSRVDSVIISVRKAAERAKNSVMASDAFFPVPDSIEKAHEAGISAIIQPGGSIRDGEVIEACDRLGIPMVLTGMRHFRH
ncbi:MAG: bifunctional phosphoribosylaminoimidazolecarboxamide formyltransferase/IMP cyclohydrolase [Candidatus Omnitrophica bacterium]|nr:bifunctional phosphoribosylaminoimidazolecarboxamide formyltransferase/IMP cyclohydrolase [Candidatus Omnitrophota bacterium]